jgi:hypothetical protein
MVDEMLQAKRLKLKTCDVANATLVATPSLTTYAEGKFEAEWEQIGRPSQPHFGCHVSDAKSSDHLAFRAVRPVEYTSAVSRSAGMSALGRD